MNSYSSGRRPRRSRGGGRRRENQERFRRPQEPAKTQKRTFWQRVAEFFGNGGEKKKAPAQPRNGTQPSSRPARKPERVEVTSPRLYVGNLSFDATESDLFELFNGVGHVHNAEVVSYRHNQRSKGFAFVQMQTVEEAKRAVEELHDKEFVLVPDRWYRLAIQMMPAPRRNSWQTDIELKLGGKMVWQHHTVDNTHPNGIESITQVFLGDERERDEMGGTWQVARAMVWEVLQADE